MPRAKLRTHKRKTNRRNKSRRQLGGAPAPSELFEAILAGDRDKVKTMLKQDINLLNSRSGELVVAEMTRKGFSPLTAACYAEKIDILFDIIYDFNLPGARILELVFEKDLKGETPYEIAVRNSELWPFTEKVRELSDLENEKELEAQIQKNIKSEMNGNPKLTRPKAEEIVRNRYAENAAYEELLHNGDD